MRRTFLFSIILAVAAMAGSSKSLLPQSPEPYSPYLSELMFYRTGAVVAMMDKTIAERIFPFSLQGKRLMPVYIPVVNENITYQVDTVMPDYIKARIISTPEGLATEKDEGTVGLQLAVLSDSPKKPIGLAITTLYPGNVASSTLDFLEFPSLAKMMEKEKTWNEGKEIFTKYFKAMYMDEDSVQNELLDLAESLNIMDTLQLPDLDVLDRMDREIPKKIKTSKMIKVPGTEDFFNIPKGVQGKEVKELIASIPFPMVAYEVSPKDMSLKAYLDYEPFVSMETAKALQPYRRPYLTYIWDGKKYRLKE